MWSVSITWASLYLISLTYTSASQWVKFTSYYVGSAFIVGLACLIIMFVLLYQTYKQASTSVQRSQPDRVESNKKTIKLLKMLISMYTCFSVYAILCIMRGISKYVWFCPRIIINATKMLWFTLIPIINAALTLVRKEDFARLGRIPTQTNGIQNNHTSNQTLDETAL